MQKNCKKCNLNFEITNSDLEFYKKISPKFNGKVFEIPEPKLCPECRQQRRLAFRNERKLYKRKCDATGENIFSMYSPEKTIKVYNVDFWWSDKWEALDYGINFNFEKSFFKQFNKLFIKVPKFALQVNSNINSLYSNNSSYQKNCYLNFLAINNENSHYSNSLYNSKNTIDCLVCDKLENSYNCVLCTKSYQIFNSFRTNSSYNSNYLFDCNNCENCYFCVGKNNLKNCILNKIYTKIDYNKEIKKINSNKQYFSEIKEKFKILVKNTPKKYYTGNNNQNFFGDEIYNSKNVYNCFDSIINCENIKHSLKINNAKNVYDLLAIGMNLSNALEGVAIGINSSNIYYSVSCWNNVSNIFYSYECLNNCSNLFGCAGLKNKQYCIFNKQYTKEEYNKLVPKIIEKMKTDGEWGEFFPANLSPFGYNETVAQEYFPLNKEEIINQNFNYSEYEAPFPKVEKIIQAKKLPENISDIPDDILNWAIECEISKKPFRIIRPELEFYRKHNLPIPKKHPDVRHEKRMKLRNPRKLFDRNCDKCGVKMKSTYDENREEIVYCEECYEKEVY